MLKSSNLLCKDKDKKKHDNQYTHQSTGSPASFWQEKLLLQQCVQRKNMTALSKNWPNLQEAITNESSCQGNMAQSEKEKNFPSVIREQLPEMQNGKRSNDRGVPVEP